MRRRRSRPSSGGPANASAGRAGDILRGGPHARKLLTLGRETFILGNGVILGNGDSVHFDQRHPYKMANVSKKMLRIL
jgi:hypothetical protein